MTQSKQENQKIHLLHLITSLTIGGAEILLLHYIRALGTEHYKHYVYCFGECGPIKEKIESLGVSVYMGPSQASIKNPIRFFISIFVLLKNLLRFIKKNRIMIIQSHLAYANQLAVLAGKIAGVPSFLTVHNTMAFVDQKSSFDLRVNIKRVVNAVIYRMADRVVAISLEVKEIIQDMFALDASKVVVLKNGIIPGLLSFDLNKSEPRKIEISKILKIIGVGSLTYQKAFEVLVRAAATLIERCFTDFEICIAGEGPEREFLEKLISELKVEDCVKLLGVRNDVGILLEASDIFVMPSRYEGLSIAMIEAMACGLPVIASDAPGLRDYISQNENGLLFEVEDHEALADRILFLANNKMFTENLEKGARQTFEREYDIRVNIKPLDELFRNFSKTRRT